MKLIGFPLVAQEATGGAVALYLLLLSFQLYLMMIVLYYVVGSVGGSSGALRRCLITEAPWRRVSGRRREPTVRGAGARCAAQPGANEPGCGRFPEDKS